MAQRFSRSALASYVTGSLESESDLPQKIAAFLVDNSKTSDLDSLMRDVMELRAEKEGIIELTVRSAFPIGQTVKSEIESVVKEQYPNAANTIIHEVIDKSLIGGVQIQFANANLDLTIQSKLHKLREAIA